MCPLVAVSSSSAPDGVQCRDHQLRELGLLLAARVGPLRYTAGPVPPAAGGLVHQVLKDGVSGVLPVYAADLLLQLLLLDLVQVQVVSESYFF